MKTPLFLLLFIVSIAAFCQDEEVLTAPRALFKTTPQSFLVNTLKVGVEVFNESWTKSYSLYLNGKLDGNNGALAYFYRGLGAEFQYRKYLNGFSVRKSRRDKEFIHGVYIAGYITGGAYFDKREFTTTYRDFNTGQITSTSYYVDDEILNVGTGFTVGYHRTFWKVLFFDAYLGGGVQLSEIERKLNPNTTREYYNSSHSGIASPGFQGIMPKFGIAVGVAL